MYLLNESKLDSIKSWSAETMDLGEFVIIDAGREVNLSGVVMQSRDASEQYVTRA
jgi:hypothetical protein